MVCVWHGFDDAQSDVLVVFRSQRPHATSGCGFFLHTSRVAWSSRVKHAGTLCRTAEPIDLPFGAVVCGPRVP